MGSSAWSVNAPVVGKGSTVLTHDLNSIIDRQTHIAYNLFIPMWPDFRGSLYIVLLPWFCHGFLAHMCTSYLSVFGIVVITF